MATSWVIRLSKDDSKKTPILVNVSRKKDGHDLDLDLLATDGDAAFTGKVRQRNLKKLQTRNYDGSDEEWSAILTYTLISKQGSTISDTQKNNLDVNCSVTGKKDNHKLSIVLRNNIEGIIQRLGAIELPETQDTEEVDLFGWALNAIEQRDNLEDELAEQRLKARAEGETEARLQKQLSDLVEAKAEHENQMLSNFVTLLNEKKLKIRNLQRVVQSAQIDPKKLEEIESALGDEDKRPMRHGTKRRVNQDPADEDESDGFETMDIDKTAEEENSPTSQRSRTPSTQSEDDDDDASLNTAPVSEPPKTRSMDKSSSKRPSSPLPAPRELPFQKKAGHKGKQPAGDTAKDSPVSAAAGEDDDEETASEEDEL